MCKMNREIKFRAWLKSEKKMYGVSELQLAFGSVVCCNLGTYARPYFYVDSEDIELMQYTGLKDKNGVEIYEGDIVKTTDECLGVIEFDTINASFAIRWFDEDSEICLEDLVFMNVDKLEVIGNIYENKELLEVEDE